MNFFLSALHFLGYVIFYQPFFNALVLLYTYVPLKDFGVAVIILTFIVRLVLYPLGAKAFYSARALSAIQPKVQELNEKHKHDKEELSRKILELYQKERINPLSALVPILVQLPVFIALYRVFVNGLSNIEPSLLYWFVPNPGHINPYFFGILNLSKASILVAILAGIFQFIQSKQGLAVNPVGQGQKSGNLQAQNMAMLGFPLVTSIFLLRLPAALGLYWVATSIFSIWQQWYLSKKTNAGNNPL